MVPKVIGKIEGNNVAHCVLVSMHARVLFCNCTKHPLANSRAAWIQNVSQLEALDRCWHRHPSNSVTNSKTLVRTKMWMQLVLVTWTRLIIATKEKPLEKTKRPREEEAKKGTCHLKKITTFLPSLSQRNFAWRQDSSLAWKSFPHSFSCNLLRNLLYNFSLTLPISTNLHPIRFPPPRIRAAQVLLISDDIKLVTFRE